MSADVITNTVLESDVLASSLGGAALDAGLVSDAGHFDDGGCWWLVAGEGSGWILK